MAVAALAAGEIAFVAFAFVPVGGRLSRTGAFGPRTVIVSG